MEKNIKGYIIFNWNTEEFRVMKKLGRKLKSEEIPIEINIRVTIPEKPTLKVEGELELNNTTVKKLVLDALDGGEFKEK